ncbi:MAG: hypothetical protein HZA50_03285 [Planctomycetes bacterium]|nr:hypothetical protein [Planctomycetota bacterium]
MQRNIIVLQAIIAVVYVCACSGCLVSENTIDKKDAKLGLLSLKYSKIFVSEIKSVRNPETMAHRWTGKATFLCRKGIRGIKEGEKIDLFIREVGFSSRGDDDDGSFMWEGFNFKKGSLWLIFTDIKDDIIVDIRSLKSIDDPIVKEVMKASDIDFMKPGDRLKAIQEILSKNDLDRNYLTEYGIIAAAKLVTRYPQSCLPLISVATEPTNNDRLRWLVLQSLHDTLFNDLQSETRPACLEIIRILMDASSQMTGCSIDLIGMYAEILSDAIHVSYGEYETQKKLIIIREAKLAVSDKTIASLKTIIAKYDENIHVMKNELAYTMLPIPFQSAWKRERKFKDLYYSIERKGDMREFLDGLTETLMEQKSSSQPTTRPASVQK